MEDGQDINFPIDKIRLRKRIGRHIFKTSLPAEKRLRRSLRLFGLLFSVHQRRELISQELFRLIQLAALPRFHLVDLFKRQERQHTQTL